MFGPFFRPEFQGISPENMAKHMRLTLAKHFRILKFPWMYPYPISFHDLQLIVCMIWLWAMDQYGSIPIDTIMVTLVGRDHDFSHLGDSEWPAISTVGHPIE